MQRLRTTRWSKSCYHSRSLLATHYPLVGSNGPSLRPNISSSTHYPTIMDLVPRCTQRGHLSNPSSSPRPASPLHTVFVVGRIVLYVNEICYCLEIQTKVKPYSSPQLPGRARNRRRSSLLRSRSRWKPRMCFWAWLDRMTGSATAFKPTWYVVVIVGNLVRGRSCWKPNLVHNPSLLGHPNPWVLVDGNALLGIWYRGRNLWC